MAQGHYSPTEDIGQGQKTHSGAYDDLWQI